MAKYDNAEVLKLVAEAAKEERKLLVKFERLKAKCKSHMYANETRPFDISRVREGETAHRLATHYLRSVHYNMTLIRERMETMRYNENMVEAVFRHVVDARMGLRSWPRRLTFGLWPIVYQFYNPFKPKNVKGKDS